VELTSPPSHASLEGFVRPGKAGVQSGANECRGRRRQGWVAGLSGICSMARGVARGKLQPMDRARVDKEIERLLRAALVEVQEQIGSEQGVEVLDHLQHNELGLAHDTLVAAIKTQQLVLGSEGTAALDAARELLGFESGVS
jgi:hypothetical protein